MAKATRGEQTRSDILQTAKRLFSLNGYFHTSTSEILDAVSVSKGAFYYHFKSKEDLALAVLEQVSRDYQQYLIELVRAAEPALRPELMLRRIVELNQSGQWSNCLLLSRMTQETAQMDNELLSEQIDRIVRELLDFWREIIADAQTAGTISKRFDSRMLAELIFTALFGAVACGELKDHIIDLSEIAEFILNILRPSRQHF